MSNKTKAQITAEILSVIFDNNDPSTTATTGKNLRILIQDFLDSVALIDGSGIILESQLPTGELLNIKVSLTSAQIQALYNTPVNLIPAPGAGKVIDLISIFTNYTFSVAPYTNTTILNIYGNPLEPSPIGQVDISASSNKLSKMVLTSQGGTDNDYILNTPIHVSSAAHIINGSGTIDIYLAYRIITL